MPVATRRRGSSSAGSLNNGETRKKSRRTVDGERNANASQTSLESVGITTSEQLVKRLKGADEKQQAIEKIVIAQVAWQDGHVPIPRKAQFLADWILGILFRDARLQQHATSTTATQTKGKAKEQSSSIEDVRFWILLEEVMANLTQDEIRIVVGRHSIVPLLASLGTAWQNATKGSIEKSQLEVTISCLHLIESSAATTSSAEQIAIASKTHLAALSKHVNSTNGALFTMPLRILVHKLSALNQAKRIRQLFLSDLLPDFCDVYVKSQDEQSLELQSCLCRLSNICIFQEKPDASGTEEFCKRVCQLNNGDAIMSMLVEQRHLLTTAEDSKQQASREDIWSTLVVPFLRFCCKQVGTAALHRLSKLLQVVVQKRLYPASVGSDQKVAPIMVVQTAINHVVSQLGNHTEAALECFLHLHRIDEGAFDKHTWQIIISHSTASPPAFALLSAFCSSHSRSRSLDAMIDTFFGSLLLASERRAQLSVEEALFSRQFWEVEVRIALREFVGGEQAVRILQSVRAHLRDALARYASSADSAFRLAAYVVSSVAYTEPVMDEASNELQGMLQELCEPRIRESSTEPALAAAALRLLNAVARRCSAEVNRVEVWSNLLKSIDDLQAPLFKSTERQSNADLQMEVLLAGLESTKRSVLMKRDCTRTVKWLEGVCTSINGDGSLQSRDGTQRQAREVSLETLRLIASVYLPVLEHSATSSLLTLLAQQVVETILVHPEHNIFSSLLQNAANLELHRWRKALALALRSQLQALQPPHKSVLLAIIVHLPPSYFTGGDLEAFVQHAIQCLNEGCDDEHTKTWLNDVGSMHGSLPPLSTPTETHSRSAKDIVADKMQRAAEEKESKGFGMLRARSEAFAECMRHDDHALHLVAQTFAKWVQQSDAQDYESSLIDFIGQCQNEFLPGNQMDTTLQTLSILLCNGPEGTLTTSRQSLGSFLATLSNAKRIDRVCLSVVHSLEAIVTGKVLLVRTSEASLILSVFSRLLTSSTSTNTTGEDADNRRDGFEGPKVFTSIVTTLIALVRLRPEALVSLLPQLSIVLCQLIGLFRQPTRSTLRSSGTQTHYLPPWLDVQCAWLGIFEARQLTRLCAAITTRTLAARSKRSGATTTSTSVATTSDVRKTKKDVSLARGFGAHALPVLVAYVCARTRVDETGAQTQFVVGETRDELQRAMFCLCDVVGTWQRSVLMDMMVDEGQRIVCRQLWRAYEEQRYRGE